MDMRAEAWSRYSDTYIIGERYGRRDRFIDVRNRIEQTDKWGPRGEWTFKKPDGSAVTTTPKVQNLIASALDDIADLASESTPTLRCDPDGDGLKAQTNAQLKTAVNNGYWIADRGELFVPQLVMDLLGAGMCYLQSYVDRSTSEYPRHRILDPRGCLPSFRDNELLDLMFVERIKARVAARLWPELNLNRCIERTDDVEVVTYFTPEEVVKCVWFVEAGYTTPALAKNQSEPRGYIVEAYENPIGRPTVAWARSTTFDRYIRGMFDQLPGILEFRQLVAQMIQDNAARAIWPETFEYNVLNYQDRGPNAVIHADSADAKWENVAPPRIPPELLSVFEEAGTEGRNMIGYAAAREGLVKQSIASNSFLEGAQGKLTSKVKSVLRLIDDLRRQQSEIDMALDERYLNFEKDLLVAVGNKSRYVPRDVIQSDYRVRVTQGMTAGLDTVQAHTVLTQDVATGFISKRTARAQSSYILDPESEELSIDREDLKQMVKQQLLQPQFAPSLLTIYASMTKGRSFMDAFAEAEQTIQQQAQQAMQASGAEAPGLPGEEPGPTPTPAGAGQQALSLMQGGIPGRASMLQQQQTIPPPFAPQPSANVRIA